MNSIEVIARLEYELEQLREEIERMNASHAYWAEIHFLRGMVAGVKLGDKNEH